MAGSTPELVDTLLRFGADWYLEAANGTLDPKIASVWRRCATAAAAARIGQSTADSATAHAELHQGAIDRHLELIGLQPAVLYQVAGGLKVHLGLAIIEQVLTHRPQNYEGPEGAPDALAALEFVTHAVEAHAIAPALQVLNIELQRDDVEVIDLTDMQPALDCIRCYFPTVMVEAIAVLHAIMGNDESVRPWIDLFEPWVVPLDD